MGSNNCCSICMYIYMYIFSILTRTSITNITKYMDTVFISYMYIYIYTMCTPRLKLIYLSTPLTIIVYIYIYTIYHHIVIGVMFTNFAIGKRGNHIVFVILVHDLIVYRELLPLAAGHLLFLHRPLVWKHLHWAD